MQSKKYIFKKKKCVNKYIVIWKGKSKIYKNKNIECKINYKDELQVKNKKKKKDYNNKIINSYNQYFIIIFSISDPHYFYLLLYSINHYLLIVIFIWIFNKYLLINIILILYEVIKIFIYIIACLFIF